MILELPSAFGLTRAPRLRFLAGNQSPATRAYSRLLEPHTRQNAINPSFLSLDKRTYLAFRHLGATGRPPFRAAMLICDPDKRPLEHVDLSAHAARFGLEVVADPKLLQLDGQLWVTFNDGWSDTSNRLFLMRLSPQPGPPLECTCPGRQPVEKNWSFFLQDGFLKAIYSLRPLRILEAPWKDALGSTPSTLRFEDALGSSATNEPKGPSLTIGPQAVAMGDRLCTIVHERWWLGQRRAYVGRLASLDPRDPGAPIHVSRTRLAHSPRAIVGRQKKFNKSLLGCTYFSGLELRDGRVLLGYGINDLTHAFAELELSDL